MRTWVACGLLLVASAAWARPSLLDRAKQAFEALKYRDALKLLEQARAEPPKSLAQSLEIWSLTGQCQAGLGDREAAEAAFEAMLKLAPNAALDPELSPKILNAFEAAKRHLFAPDYVQLRASAEPGERRVEVVDPWRRVVTVMALTRSTESRTWDEVRLEIDNQTVVIAPDRFPGKAYLYLEARGGDGQVVAHLGSAAMPLNVLSGRPVDASGDGAPPTEVVGEARPLRRWSWLPAAAGLALIGVGAACDGVAKLKYDQLTSGPPFPAPDVASRLRDEGKSLQTTGAVFLGVGAAGLATAGLMYLWPEAPPATLSMSAGPHGAWVGVTGALP